MTQLENGNRAPTGPLLTALAELYAVSAENLVSGVDPVVHHRDDSSKVSDPKPGAVPPNAKPWVEVPLGDIDEMIFDPAAWIPASDAEPWTNDPVAERFCRWVEEGQPFGNKERSIRIARDGKKKKDGDFKFTLRDGMFYLALRDEGAVVHRNAVLIGYMFLYHFAKTIT